MAQLGNRILFYETTGKEPTEEELMTFAANYEGNTVVNACQKVVNDFLEAYFTLHPPDSIDPKTVEIPTEIQRGIVRYATLIAHGRVEIISGSGADQPEAGTAEGPHRIILLLQTLARGLALAAERSTVNTEDVATIRHVAFSSIPHKRRQLLRALVSAGEPLSAEQVENALGVSRPTARVRMQELAATSIAVFTPGKEDSSTPATLTLADNWHWLREGPPEKESGVCGRDILPPERNSGACELGSECPPLKTKRGVEDGEVEEGRSTDMHSHTPKLFSGGQAGEDDPLLDTGEPGEILKDAA
jgi:hypothetical protein